ncbi:MAG: TlpA family protein disulfide reductase [Bacteroidia bacterium]
MAQQITYVQTQDLINLKNNKSDTVYILNFWATWCKPCVEELPYLEKLNEKYSDKKVKVILLSNDFSRQVETKLKPFVKNNNIKSSVYFINEKTPNNWMPFVSEQWNGNIPATLVVFGNKNVLQLYDEQLNYEQLEVIVNNILNK